MFSIWLTPSKQSLIPLLECINANSHKLSRPSYIPHMTLFFSEKSYESASKCFSALAESHEWGKINLKTGGIIENKSSFYMGLYISLSKTPELDDLFNGIRTLDPDSTYLLSPHISIAYGIDGYGCNDLSHYDTDEIVFDTISLVSCKIDESNEAISSWEIVKSFDL